MWVTSPGCRRARAAQPDAGPSTASAPIGCWICRGGHSASPGSQRGRWGCSLWSWLWRSLPAQRPTADLSSPFLCPASSFLRGSPSPDAAATAQCRCTRILQTQNRLHCQVSPEAPARSLETLHYAGWVRHTRSAAPLSPGSEVLVEGPGGDLAERLRVRWVRVSRSSRAALTTIDLQDLADCTSLLGPEAPSSADSSASQVLFPLFGS